MAGNASYDKFCHKTGKVKTTEAIASALVNHRGPGYNLTYYYRCKYCKSYHTTSEKQDFHG